MSKEHRAANGEVTIAEDAPAEAPAGATVVEGLTDGPLMVKGGQLLHADGRTEVRSEHTAFCRCGRSGNKPFGDGSHRKASEATRTWAIFRIKGTDTDLGDDRADVRG
jgi:CDGSH-type Zn-finger protein